MILYVDGSSNLLRSGARLILFSPEGDVAAYALRFEFSIINNEVEYKALIAGLNIAKEARAHHLKIFNDS